MATQPAASPFLETEAIRNILRQVIDPEVGMNIVDLGLVYRIEAAPDCIRIDMTMTSPACPMGEMITGEAHAALVDALPETCRPDIRLVWDPPWDPSMMSDRTKAHFGWEP